MNVNLSAKPVATQAAPAILAVPEKTPKAAIQLNSAPKGNNLNVKA